VLLITSDSHGFLRTFCLFVPIDFGDEDFG